MSFVAIGLFVLACGWNVYRLFLPTRAAALRNEGHPQYFGAALAAGYVAFLAIFLHASLIQTSFYPVALGAVVKLAPHVDQGDKDPDDDSDPKDSSRPSLSIQNLIVEASGVVDGTLAKSAAVVAENEGKKKASYSIVLAVGMWSAILALILPFVLNAPFRRNARLRLLAGRKSFNDVEEVLLESLERGTSVAITLTTGKVYVGIPNEFDPNGAEADWVSLWPLASGYRTKKGRLILTTAYEDAYEKINGDVSDSLSSDDFKVTLPLVHIVSIQNFKLQFYVSHFARLSDESHEDLSMAVEQGELESNNEMNLDSVVGDSVSVSAAPGLLQRYVVSDSWLKVLKWAFHLFFTAAVVGAPFSIAFCMVMLVAALFSLLLLDDPAEHQLDLLIDAMKEA